MENKLMKKINLDLVLADVENYCYSELSVKKFNELNYIKNYDDLVLVHRENSDVELLHKKYPGEFKLNIFDYYSSLKKAKIESILSEKELYHILKNIELYARFIKKMEYIKTNDLNEYKYISKYIENISDFPHLISYLNKIVDEDGYIRYDATPELKAIKDKVKGLTSKSDKILKNIIRTSSNKLTEAIVTKRNERYVILVKPEYKNDFGGIIHDQSASGNTYYIEPRENVEINNEISILQRKEKEEILNILKEATVEIDLNSRNLKKSLDNFAHIEFIFSKVNYALNKKFVRPIIEDNQRINLKNAYNPLIEEKTVVKNDIYLDNEEHSLIITGPNTGGKTVILKTVGLCTAMTHLGLYIPASEKSSVGFFENIFIDIGDDQSIENNLSTFSSHMTNIVSILNNTSSKSLVLLDELCSGTDPAEGAALSMAILNKFKDLGATILCTTHYPEIKDYCFKSKYYKNSSLEFDFEKMKPTYKFIIGLPGKSNAINISSRIGLSSNITEEAESYLEETEKENSRFIDELSRNIKTYEDKILEVDTSLIEINEIRKNLEKELNEFSKYKDSLYSQFYNELNIEIESKKEELYSIYKDFKNKSDSIKQHEFNDLVSKFNNEKKAIFTTNTQRKTDPTEIKIGDDVLFLKYNQRAEVLDIKGKTVTIKLGSLKLNVDMNEIQKIEKDKVKEKSITHSISKTKSTTNVGLDVNVIGKNTEEAIRIVEDYIDKVLLMGYDTFTIIHGVGSGILKKNIANYLKENKYVLSYRSGGQGEGGLGVTIVEMR